MQRRGRNLVEEEREFGREGEEIRWRWIKCEVEEEKKKSFIAVVSVQDLIRGNTFCAAMR